METKNWRDAKLPQWVRDSIAADMKASELRAALSWPTKTKPEPLPFQWVDYGLLRGVAREGAFWSAFFASGNGYVLEVHIKKNDGTIGTHYREWAFSSDGEKWNTNVQRGPLFETERDASLWLLWAACEECAVKLADLRQEAMK